METDARASVGTGPITASEAKAIIPYLERVGVAESDEARRAALDEGIVAWGPEFLGSLSFGAQKAPDWAPIRDMAVDRYSHWLAGATLSSRADEDERRALAALREAERAPKLARWAVVALLALPPRHDLRHTRLPAALGMLRANIDAGQQDDAIDDVLMAIAALIQASSDGAGAEALLRRGESLLDRASEDTAIRTFRLQGGNLLVQRAIAARDGGDGDAAHELAARARRLLDPLIDDAAAERDPYAFVLGGLVSEVEADVGRALDLYLAAAAKPLEQIRRDEALNGILRTGVLAGRHDAVIGVAREALAGLIEQYAAEPDAARSASRRETLDRALADVCESCAETRNLELLLWALESTSSARLRQRIKVRSGRAGRRIRTLEAALWTAQRRLGGQSDVPQAVREGRAARVVTTQTLLEEAYRRDAHGLSAVLETPTPVAVASRLRADEGVAVLATGRWGTAVLLLHHAGDGADPLEGDILPVPLSSWASSLIAEDDTGWAFVLGAPWEYGRLTGADPQADLDRALGYAEEEIGTWLADWAGRRGLRRLWVVPHGVLGLLPWWAVPSLRGIDVRHVPTLAMLPRARGIARLTGCAVVVGNATGDLPAADPEALVVAEHMREGGLSARVLAGDLSTEAGITAAVRGARVLHFCGHGTSDLDDSAYSALHVRPEARWAGAGVPAELADLAATALWAATGPETREAEVTVPDADGNSRPALLREEALQQGITLRHLEYDPTGTLLAAYLDGRLVRLPELWSAGDIAVSGALRDLRLAVLSACQSGGGGLHTGSDEFVGLPSAMTLAGVRSILCTAWAVDDVLSAVTADLLWELLSSRQSRVVDLYAVVREVRGRLATMAAEEVRRRVDRLRRSAPAGRDRFQL
jgi:hypothetical protein